MLRATKHSCDATCCSGDLQSKVLVLPARTTTNQIPPPHALPARSCQLHSTASGALNFRPRAQAALMQAGPLLHLRIKLNPHPQEI